MTKQSQQSTRTRQRRRVQTKITGDSMTHQSERDKTDINNMLRRGAVPPPPHPGQMQFGDFSDGADFQFVQDQIAEVHQFFDQLPAETRYKFANDPARMLDFVADSANDEESYELGLKQRPNREVTDNQQDTKKSSDENSQPVDKQPDTKQSSDSNKDKPVT